MTKRDTGAVRVADPEGLARVLREAIVGPGIWSDPMDPELPRGAQTEILDGVAEDSGVSRPYFHRLLNAYVRGDALLGWGTILKLEKWLKRRERTKELVDDLFVTILGPSAAQARRGYAKYVEREYKRLGVGRGEEHEVSIFPPRIEKVKRNFEIFAQKRGCPPLRIELAKRRVFDPIIGSPELRRAIEADEDLYVASVKLGYKRERLHIEKELYEFHAKS